MNENIFSNIRIDRLRNESKYYIDSGIRKAYVSNQLGTILLNLKNGRDAEHIAQLLNVEYKTESLANDIDVIVESHIKPLFRKNENQSKLLKLVNLINPEKVLSHKFKRLIPVKSFFAFLITFFILNSIIFTNTSSQDLNGYEHGLFYFIFVIVLVFHEIGHAIAASKFNVNSKEIGFGFYYIIPVFYTNLTEIWRLDSRQRNIVNLSGIYFQLILGCVMFCANLMINSKVIDNLILTNYAIILINLNPFLRFDGYWILSDILNEPNLMQKSNFLITEIKQQRKIIIIYSLLRKIFLAGIALFIFTKVIQIFMRIKASEVQLWDSIFLLFIAVFVILKLHQVLKIRKK